MEVDSLSNVFMSGSEALIDHLHGRTADGVLKAHRDSPIEPRLGQAHCGACGRAWFGDVDYCPYCGLPSASSPAKPAAAPSPAFERAEAAREHVSQIDRRPAQGWDALSVPVLLAIDSAADERSLPPKSSLNATALVAGVVVIGAIALAALPLLDGQIEAPPGGAAAAGLVIDNASPESPHRVAPPNSQALVPAPEAAASTPVVLETREQSVPEGDPSMSEPMATAEVMPDAERQAPLKAQPSVPLPRHRALCSAASEAAGLCNPN
ncbi:hypothetical protein WG922_21830 [Ramlibacter sp. AN1015]|uniref:hypothetical protein n=1 Tax=Ramlibacter sp. AN1015 TaxID=3133428 RepID=UPI0030C4CE27